MKASSPEQETLVVKLTRSEHAILEVLGRKLGLPVDLQILAAVADFVKKKRSFVAQRASGVTAPDISRSGSPLAAWSQPATSRRWMKRIASGIAALVWPFPRQPA